MRNEIMLCNDLQSLIKEEALSQMDGCNLKLTEPKAKMSIVLKGTPKSIMAIRLDEYSHLSCLDDHIIDISKKCDYLLIDQKNGISRAIFIEMKTTLSDERYKEQLRRSLPILKYLLSVYSINYGVRLEESDINIKYILIVKKYDRIINKMGMKPVTRSQPLQKEDHENIQINIFGGTEYSFTELAN